MSQSLRKSESDKAFELQIKTSIPLATMKMQFLMLVLIPNMSIIYSLTILSFCPNHRSFSRQLMMTIILTHRRSTHVETTILPHWPNTRRIPTHLLHIRRRLIRLLLYIWRRGGWLIHSHTTSSQFSRVQIVIPPRTHWWYARMSTPRLQRLSIQLRIITR